MEQQKKQKNIFKRAFFGFLMWFDSEGHDGSTMQSEKINIVRCIPFAILHLSCFAVIWVGWSPAAVITAVCVYIIQMFTVTGLYHRYFSHKTFKTSRVAQFLFALIGGAAIQKGALWWAANHRHHHRFSDQPEDVHSPIQRGFWWSHMGWIMADKYFNTDYKMIPDLAKFPELRLLNRFDIFVPIFAGTAVFFFGVALNSFFPELGTSGGQMLVWGYFIASVLSLHGTFTINSLSHVWGSQRFNVKDTSRNNPFLAIVTLGEGWHNNHHRYPAATRQGFYWWEYDVTYYILKTMSLFGIVWDLKPVPKSIYEEVKGKRDLNNLAPTEDNSPDMEKEFKKKEFSKTD